MVLVRTLEADLSGKDALFVHAPIPQHVRSQCDLLFMILNVMEAKVTLTLRVHCMACLFNFYFGDLAAQAGVLTAKASRQAVKATGV
eukprot:2413919-Karenia_brevis.AAC.1